MDSDADSQEVLTRIKQNGTFDEIRLRINDELKNSKALQAFVQEKVDNSKTLNSLDASRTQNKKQVLEALKKELELTLLAEAARCAYEISSSENTAVCKLIDSKVHEALCDVYEERRRLSGYYHAAMPPAAPQ